MIDFDALVNRPCVRTFGRPVTITLFNQQPIWLLADGSPLLGVYEEAQKDVHLENGAYVDTVRPRLGFSLSDLHAAGLTPDVIDDEATVIEVAGKAWSVMELQGPDSQGDVQIMLKVLEVG